MHCNMQVAAIYVRLMRLSCAKEAGPISLRVPFCPYLRLEFVVLPARKSARGYKHGQLSGGIWKSAVITIYNNPFRCIQNLHKNNKVDILLRATDLSILFNENDK